MNYYQSSNCQFSQNSPNGNFNSENKNWIHPLYVKIEWSFSFIVRKNKYKVSRVNMRANAIVESRYALGKQSCGSRNGNEVNKIKLHQNWLQRMCYFPLVLHSAKRLMPRPWYFQANIWGLSLKERRTFCRFLWFKI